MNNNTQPPELYKAAQYGNRERVLELLKGKVNVDERAPESSTALMAAAGHDRYEIVVDLLDASADLKMTTKSGDTALHWAARGDAPLAITTLIQRGADADWRNNNERTPLFEATSCGYLAAVRALIQGGASVDMPDNHGDTPVHVAVQRGNGSVILPLLVAKANIQKTNDEGKKPLHYAQREGHDGIADALMRHDKSIRLAQPPQGESVGARVFSRAAFSVVEIQNDGGRTIGSGVVVMPGVVATNYHLVGRGRVWVAFGSFRYPAKIRDDVVEHDFSLLDVDEFYASERVAKIRPYNTLHIGEEVYAIGHPEGENHSMSAGVIAHLRPKNGRRRIQTDVATSPGSSGGGLFDREGNLIGIHIGSHPSKDVENINYALPADLVFGYSFPRVFPNSVITTESSVVKDEPVKIPCVVKIDEEKGAMRVSFYHPETSEVSAYAGRQDRDGVFHLVAEGEDGKATLTRVSDYSFEGEWQEQNPPNSGKLKIDLDPDK